MAEQEAPGTCLSTQTATATAETLKGVLWGEMEGHRQQFQVPWRNIDLNKGEHMGNYKS